MKRDSRKPGSDTRNAQTMCKSKPVLTRHSSNLEGQDLPAGTLPADLDLKAATLKLFEFSYSMPSVKVRALLKYYQVPYESVATQPHQKRDEIDNSYGKVPKLLITSPVDVQINDSAVIVRTLAPLLTGGEALTPEQVELEKLNNISGFLGALEKESFGSFYGIAGAVKHVTSAWRSKTASAVVSYSAGLLWPVPYLMLKFAPMGKDGDSLTHAKVYRKALGDDAFFHGKAPGPLDISLYGSLACFLALGSPYANAALDRADLRAWYDRTEKAYLEVVGAPLF